ASTKNVKPTNPHTSPHYNADLDCVNCHVGHEPSENYCAQCHNFDFKVP
ncbi:cytochrome c3 family protein, partial [Sutterella wadsworthensis]